MIMGPILFPEGGFLFIYLLIYLCLDESVVY